MYVGKDYKESTKIRRIFAYIRDEIEFYFYCIFPSVLIYHRSFYSSLVLERKINCLISKCFTLTSCEFILSPKK